jgi:hypothetical protein
MADSTAAATSNVPSAAAEPSGGVPDPIPPPVLEELEVIFVRWL